MSDKLKTIPDIIAYHRQRAKEILGNGVYEDILEKEEAEDAALDHEEEADRIEAAYNRERATTENSSAVGNTAKLREALENCANMGEQIDCQLGSSDATVYAFRHERCLAHNISECARDALAAPARNCDVGTADEQWVRFKKHCEENLQADDPDYCSSSCDVDGECVSQCALKWAQMPCREGCVK